MACAGATIHSEPPICRQLPITGNAVSGVGKGAISAGMGLHSCVLTCSPCHRLTQTYASLQYINVDCKQCDASLPKVPLCLAMKGHAVQD